MYSMLRLYFMRVLFWNMVKNIGSPCVFVLLTGWSVSIIMCRVPPNCEQPLLFTFISALKTKILISVISEENLMSYQDDDIVVIMI